jgi:hypothetical protein
MQQRRVRLGDILDDYCPRERRITNHAVVAMIEDEVKQTRCTTCDADHEYKQAKVPATRRKKPEASLVASAEGATFARPPVSDPEPPVIDEDMIAGQNDLLDEPLVEAAADADAPDVAAEPGEPETAAPDAGEAPLGEPEPSVEASADEQDEWPVHRPLIRATLPRPEGQTPERKAPDFTIRQNGGRFDGQRNGNRHRGQRQAHGHSSGGQSRFSNSRSGSGHGQSSGHGQRHGNRPGPSGGHRGGGPAGEQRGGGRPGGQGGRGQGRGPKRGR